MQTGHLIILNGGSSAGKTSTCSAFQDLCSIPYVRLGMDRFWSSIPPIQMQVTTAAPDYYVTHTYYEDHKPYFHVTPGPILDKIMYASYCSISAYLNLGLNVISDQIFWKPDWLKKALLEFYPFKVYLIALYVSDEEGAKREQARSAGHVNDTAAGGRPDGWNRCSSRETHKNMIYDLEIDNTRLSIHDTALQIKQYVMEHPNPTSFSRLFKKTCLN